MNFSLSRPCRIAVYHASGDICPRCYGMQTVIRLRQASDDPVTWRCHCMNCKHDFNVEDAAEQVQSPAPHTADGV